MLFRRVGEGGIEHSNMIPVLDFSRITTTVSNTSVEGMRSNRLGSRVEPCENRRNERLPRE